ncbi:MAG: response regulator [Bacteroidales bacterium]|nr:response regulator [Bacteroidales bacterium]
MGRFAVVGIFLLISLSNFSQKVPLHFTRITTQNGLTNSWVRCIYQDEKGYIWFGTKDGLNRYDGYKCKTYRPENKEGFEMGNIPVNEILEINNEIWLATDLGLYVYDFSGDKLIQLPYLPQEPVLSMLVDSKEQIWLGTNNSGLYRLNLSDETISNYTYSSTDPASISDNYINVIFEDSNSNLWVGTKNGLNEFKNSTNTFIRYQTSRLKNSISGDDILAITEDQNKQIWIGTAQDGVSLIIPGNNDEVEFKHIISGKIIDLLVDHLNILWIARGSGEGLSRIHLNDFSLKSKPKVEQYFQDKANPESISDNSIFCLFQDRLNDIWIGTFGAGVNYYSHRTKKFNVIKEFISDKDTVSINLVNTFFEEKDFLWIGSEAGLDRYNKNTGDIKHFTSDSKDSNSLGSNSVFAVFKDSRNNLWIGTWAGGLNLYDYKTESFKRFIPDNRPGSISNANIFSIFEDSRGNLWIGTVNGGLNRYNYLTGRFIQYKNDINNPTSLGNNSINEIIETKDGRLLIVTTISIEEYVYETNSFHHYWRFWRDSVNTQGEILSIHEDKMNNIWVATNLGLELFDIKQKVFTPFTISEQLPDKTIQGILEDNAGNIWISTNKGISKIVEGTSIPQNPITINYTTEDGIAGNESTKRAVYKTREGLMYIGSSGGITYFNPDSILLNTNLPRVVLTGFNILSSAPGENVEYKTIEGNIESINKLDLSYKNSDFIIQFAALNYLSSAKNQYRYKLEGYDKNWIDAKNQRSATYTNIHPGKYIFKVIGSNNDGIWNPEPVTLDIEIHPPWWKTLAFKILVLVILVVVLYSIYRIRVSILNKQKKILEEKVKERTHELSEINTLLEERTEEISIQNDELSRHRNHLEELIIERTKELNEAKDKAEESDRLKTAFLANMSHEIRTPMNGILGFASLLERPDLDGADQHKYIHVIKQSGQRMLNIINDLIDISKIEAGQIDVRNEETDLNQLLKSLYTFFQPEAAKRKLQFSFEKKLNDSECLIYTDKTKLSQVLTNLIKNALKYTRSGSINFGYTLRPPSGKKKNKMLQFYVSDTGLGINTKSINKIFERFRQADLTPEKFEEGAGLGLSISKAYVEIMGGNIWVESESGKGSVFYFTVPYILMDKQGVIDKDKNINNISFKDISLLIAEDDTTSYLYLKEILKETGINILYAANGQEAIELVKNTPEIKIILMDIKMPKVNGLDATKQIKKIHPEIVIIAQTAFASVEDEKRAIQAGCNDYISKPIDKNLLFEKLDNHLNKF